MSSNDKETKTFSNRDIVFESGGVKFVLHVSADMTVSPPPTPQPNPVTPGPTPQPEPEAGVAADGVKMMFAENKNAKAKPFFIDLDNPDKDHDIFATTYGSKVYPFEKPTPMTEDNIKFVRNKGAKQTYASGAPPGKSCRFHISAGANMGKVGKYSWKDKPTPAYVTATDTCFYSHEMTVIARVGKPLGTHQSFAFKLNSRPDKPDDTLRSTIEFCMPNDQKPDAYVNYNFAHAGYSKVTGLKQYFKEGKIEPNKWIGVKNVFIIGDDRKASWMGLYVNLNPITDKGEINNNDWKLKAEYTAKGIKEYDMIPPVWGGDSYLRVDGYEYVDLFRYSQIEILKGPLKNPSGLDLALGQSFTEPQVDVSQDAEEEVII